MFVPNGGDFLNKTVCLFKAHVCSNIAMKLQFSLATMLAAPLAF
jgi:hypothetical protein